ncbi:MAG: ABC transporter ATP-binding protein [Burkholderiales bacterium]|nr:ABC transporter ATP-binding protein [Burkholderiales bacterium]
MNKDIAIKVENLSKVYKLYNAPLDRMKEALHPFKKSYHKKFYALNDVSFEIKKGDCVGILGKNGAGKSTLLKIITGVLNPTNGSVTINGRVSALLELGAGFNPEYTGMENIYFQGNLMGFSHDEVKVKVAEILNFAEIGDFIHQPVKNYSSGMFARLAFAVAINVEPDILIVDEALSVGDSMFQHKCINKMRQIMDNQTTILFVSHSLDSVVSLCDRGIWLDGGKKIMDDISSVVVNEFHNEVFLEHNRIVVKNLEEEHNNQVNIAKNDNVTEDIKNSNIIVIEEAYIENSVGLKVAQIKQDESFAICIKFKVNQDLHNLSLGIVIKDQFGLEMTGESIFNTFKRGISLKNGDSHIIKFSSINILRGGQSYSVNVRVNMVSKWDRSDNIQLYNDEVATVFEVCQDFDNPMWFKFKQNFGITII